MPLPECAGKEGPGRPLEDDGPWTPEPSLRHQPGRTIKVKVQGPPGTSNIVVVPAIRASETCKPVVVGFT